MNEPTLTLTDYAKSRLDEKEQRAVLRACEKMPLAVEAVTAAYMKDGQGHTLPEVAEMTGASLSMLRLVARELANGFAPQAAYRQWKDSVEELTHGYGKGSPPRNAWYPTREHLRSVLLARVPQGS